MIGVILGKRYRIIKHLGAGGFGQTYLAEDQYLPGKPLCVVKQFQPQSDDPQILETAQRLFDQEAQILYKLGKHPYIPKLLAHLEDHENFYLVLEFMEGYPLSQELLPERPLGEAYVINYLNQVLPVIEFIHQHKIIHRDIKPSNLIRCNKDGAIAVIDFGAVKQIHTQTGAFPGHSSLTIAIGSQGYMPNEQLAGQPRFNSDLYSVGMIAIQALTGLPPKRLPKDPRTSELLWRDRVPGSLSPELADLLDKMTRYNFRDRYQSATEVLNTLHCFVDQTTGTADLSCTTVVNQDTLDQYQELLQKGETLLNQQQFDAAIACYDQASQLNPDAAEVWYWKGRALYGQQQLEAAIAAYTRALQLNPSDAETWHWRGGALARVGRFPEAEFSFDRATQLNPDNGDSWYWRGRSLHQLKHYPEAITAYDRAIRLQTNIPDYWYWRGLALAELKRLPEALAAYDQAIAIAPTFQPALNERQRLQTKLKSRKWFGHHS
ncbi:tetratricopeptide repeat protein [Pantanalinema rosaneae CENA516]